jgi:D-glycero-alpha-D-manno-heptose-7-phosphate kinase
VEALGQESAAALVEGRLEDFGELLSLQWELKRERSPSAVHERVDAWINRGISAGAKGGKLVGAGGGGFLLFYSHRSSELRAEMAKLGLREVRFKFDSLGTTLMPW